MRCGRLCGLRRLWHVLRHDVLRRIVLRRGGLLRRRMLRHSTVRHSALRHGSLRHTGLGNTRLRNSRLRQAVLRNADLRNAGLRKPGLRNTRLRHPRLDHTGLDHAGLRRHRLLLRRRRPAREPLSPDRRLGRVLPRLRRRHLGPTALRPRHQQRVVVVQVVEIAEVVDAGVRVRRAGSAGMPRPAVHALRPLS
ncbi:pentapeptide repeat-containing protein [Streptodolium elevatio]|uniref:Pentapeptide repeat-containing protein n=1 Tax=Streptodolium elevatio TaxID=3157996 RepID=A0ABV3DWD2_9ACTN